LKRNSRGCTDRQKHHSLCIIDLSKKFGNRAVLHHRAYGSWQETSWNQLAEQMHAVAAALLESGVKEGDRVGIFSNNRSEWHIADLGSMLIRAIDVPIYPTNSTKEAEFSVNHSGLKILFLAGQAQDDRGDPL
jgi:long-chain acyl-CoA synthetase